MRKKVIRQKHNTHRWQHAKSVQANTAPRNHKLLINEHANVIPDKLTQSSHYQGVDQ